MGTIQCGRCQCQCYINFVSFDYTSEQITENEIRTQRSNRFIDQPTRSKKRKQSPNDSSERQSKFSSTRKPTSRSSSGHTKYLMTEFCNITSEDSQKGAKQQLRRIRVRDYRKSLKHFIPKSRSMYQFEGVYKEEEATQQKSLNYSHLAEVDQTQRSLSGGPASQSRVHHSADHDRDRKSSNVEGVLKKASSIKQSLGQQQSTSQSRVRWNLPSSNIEKNDKQQQLFFC